MTADQKRNKAIRSMWTAIVGKPWPKGWQIVWNTAGMTIPLNKIIYLSMASVTDSWDLEVLCHELVHMEHPNWKHGRYFEKRVKEVQKEARRWIKETKRLRVK